MASAAKIAKISQSQAYVNGFSLLNLETGGFSGLVYNEKTKFDMSADIMVEQSSKNNKEYIWVLGERNDVEQLMDKKSKLYKDLPKACKVLEFKNRSEFDWQIQSQLMSYFSGYFFVSDIREKGANEISVSKSLDEMTEGGYLSIDLEPISKKEFILKEY